MGDTRLDPSIRPRLIVRGYGYWLGRFKRSLRPEIGRSEVHRHRLKELEECDSKAFSA